MQSVSEVSLLPGSQLNASLRCEVKLLSLDKLERWAGLSGGWFATGKSDVDIHPFEPDRPYLAMLEHGRATVEYVIGSERLVQPVEEGAMCLLLPNGPDIRHYRWRPEGTRQVKFEPDIQLMCEQGWLDERFANVSLRQDLNFYDSQLSSLLRCMVHEIANGSPTGKLYAESLSVGVVHRLIETHGAQLNVRPERGKLTESQLRRVKSLIHDSLCEDLSVQELAAASGLSKPHFTRLFKNSVGLAPHRYVMKVRLERAYELLRTTDLPLAEVASATGFASQSHLTDAFSGTYLTTPGTVRRQHRS